MKTIDLNIFYRENWEELEGTWWSETLTIDPYIYESDEHGTRKYETELLIECTAEETAEIAKHYPENEYGVDWWDFFDNFKEFGPTRIVDLINTISLDRKTESAWDVTLF